MTNIVVGIGDCHVSGDRDRCLITYALGSCVALAIYDPVSHVGGMLHYLLPDSRLHAQRSGECPFLFADTGIPALFHRAYRLGAIKARIRVTAAGGACVLGTGLPSIGRLNQDAMSRILGNAGVRIHYRETGGNQARTLRLDLQHGRVLVTLAGTIHREIVPGQTGYGRAEPAPSRLDDPSSDPGAFAPDRPGPA